jgi:hypothetical protein
MTIECFHERTAFPCRCPRRWYSTAGLGPANRDEVQRRLETSSRAFLRALPDHGKASACPSSPGERHDFRGGCPHEEDSAGDSVRTYRGCGAVFEKSHPPDCCGRRKAVGDLLLNGLTLTGRLLNGEAGMVVLRDCGGHCGNAILPTLAKRRGPIWHDANPLQDDGRGRPR